MCIRKLFARKGEERPKDAKNAATELYFANAAAIISSFDSWKGDDRFYFIELDLDLSYHLGTRVVLMAEPPYHLGTLVRCSLEHPELFSFQCPSCGERVYAYTLNGSPQSGRVDLSGECPRCGWRGGVSVSGWRSRSIVLRETQREDAHRLSQALGGPEGFSPASIDNLLEEIGGEL
jgi:predicted RNA-binding Zn-ribbon protein involved in translation (DUF1610 family)